MVTKPSTPMLRQHGSFLFVGVPESDFTDIEIIRDQDNYEQQQLKFPSDKVGGLQNYSWIDLPLGGQYSIVGLCNDLTEEQWEPIVKTERWDSGKWNDYELYLARVNTAKQSGFSLLRSLGFEPGQNVLAIKIEK